MARLTLSVFALVLACNTGWSQIDVPGRIPINTGRVGQNLLLTAEIPAATVGGSASAANTRLQTLARALPDVSRAFVLPKAAGCEQTGGDDSTQTILRSHYARAY